MNKSTSIYLDLVRFFAAATVFVVHANYPRFTGGLPLVWRLHDLGNDAVMVFFVLSGYVIAHVSAHKENCFTDYAASRLARLYSVALPALLLTVALDAVGVRLAPSLYDGWWFQADRPALRFVANLFFVNELWFTSIRPFSNGPYWSLGYEFWFYAIYAAAHYGRGRMRYLCVAALLLLVGPKILLLLPVWLLGVFAYRCSQARPVSLGGAYALTLGSVLAYVAFRQLQLPQLLQHWSDAKVGAQFAQQQLAWSQYFLSSYVIGLLVALHFIGAATLAPRMGESLLALERPARLLGGYTFALYLFHYPLLQFFAALSVRWAQPAWQAAIVVTGTLIAVALLGSVTEARKHDVRRWIHSGFARVARVCAPAAQR